MATERIGYLLVSEKFQDINREPGEVMLGLGFLPVHYLDGKETPWWSEEKSAELGFKRVAAYLADVTYHGDKITHTGLEIRFLASCSDELEARIRKTPPGLVVGLMSDFYDSLPSRRSAK